MDNQHNTLFSLTCPTNDKDDERINNIVARGNLPLLVDGQILAEISNQELQESWETATCLSAKKLSLMTKKAANQLQELLTEDSEPDVAEVVADAAVLFLLAMRRLGVAEPKRIPACTINWTSPDQPEQVKLLG